MLHEFTFRTHGSDNQVELSRELVDHLAEHRVAIPAHEDDDRDMRFVLCQYKHARAPSSRRSGYEHRISRDENATIDDWSLRSLRNRHPGLQYQGMPVIFVGIYTPFILCIQLSYNPT
jgi:hypothetical protein